MHTHVKPSRFALQFFGMTACLVMLAGTIGYSLSRIFLPIQSDSVFHPTFGVSTVFLFLGSFWLHRSVRFVRREKQAPFRRSLGVALLMGVLFVGTQSFAVQVLIPPPDYTEANLGIRPFLVVFIALHALHFLIALMFLAFVTLKAMHDRYDHEFYWSVQVCAYFWDFLGAVWMAILMVFLIAS